MVTRQHETIWPVFPVVKTAGTFYNDQWCSCTHCPTTSRAHTIRVHHGCASLSAVNVWFNTRKCRQHIEARSENVRGFVELLWRLPACPVGWRAIDVELFFCHADVRGGLVLSQTRQSQSLQPAHSTLPLPRPVVETLLVCL